MRLPEEPELPPQINIVPMIDVIFAILTFFILSTLFLTRSEGLPVNLPKAATGQKQVAQTQIVVTVDRQGYIALNKKPIRLDALVTQIKSLIPPNQQAVVVVNADERVSHGQVVTVLDQVRQVQGARIAIATTRP